MVARCLLSGRPSTVAARKKRGAPSCWMTCPPAVRCDDVTCIDLPLRCFALLRHAAALPCFVVLCRRRALLRIAAAMLCRRSACPPLPWYMPPAVGCLCPALLFLRISALCPPALLPLVALCILPGVEYTPHKVALSRKPLHLLPLLPCQPLLATNSAPQSPADRCPQVSAVANTRPKL